MFLFISFLVGTVSVHLDTSSSIVYTRISKGTKGNENRMESKARPLRLILKPYPNTYPRSEHITTRRMSSASSFSTLADDKEALLKVPPTQILPFLYLGNERDASDLIKLTQMGIEYVLNVTCHLPLPGAGCSQENITGLRYKRLPALDSCKQNIKQYFEEAFTFIGK